MILILRTLLEQNMKQIAKRFTMVFYPIRLHLDRIRYVVIILTYGLCEFDRFSSFILNCLTRGFRHSESGNFFFSPSI